MNVLFKNEMFFYDHSMREKSGCISQIEVQDSLIIALIFGTQKC